MNERSIPYPCPYCNDRTLQTVETVPFVRGFLIAFQLGYKTYIGCCRCVRGKVLKQTGLSTLLGWYSITALFINPFLIMYGLIRTVLVTPRVDKVRAQLEKAGIPGPSEQRVDILAMGYGLAASMITADGKIVPDEVEVASAIGERIFEGFDREHFAEVLADHRHLAEPGDLASVLANVLDEEGKTLVLKYVAAIATADGAVDASEEQLVGEIAAKLGLGEAGA